MKKSPSILLGILLILSSCSLRNNPDISNEDISEIINFIASDSLKGRLPGTVEDSILLDFIASEFKSIGLESPQYGYIQDFDLISGIEVGEQTTLKFGDKSYEIEKDFYPSGYSSSGIFSSEVLFCGYGFMIESEDLTRNDYKNIDIDGKWAVILKGTPNEYLAFKKFSKDRDKVMLAADKGAIGVLLVSSEGSPQDELSLKLNKEPEVSIPVVQIKRTVFEEIYADIDLKSIESDLSSKVVKKEILSKKILNAHIELNKLNTPTGNVIGMLKGTDPEKADEWIVVGAHHDHLGMGGAANSSRMPDTIAVHNGADDNASGVSAVIELASYFSSKNIQNSRSILFVTFGAEEKGLIGSKYFVDNCPVPTENILSMVNIDMLGRMSPDSSLQIGGVGTSKESKSLVESINTSYNLNLKLSEAGYGPSDHASFYTKDIPVFFFSTGAHQDYHTPFDDIDSLNINGLRLSIEFIADLIVALDNTDSLEYQEAGPKASSGTGYTGSVTLGIMPDVSGADEGGLKILAVTKGKPAYSSGIQKGDIIVAIDGNEVGNIYDYMYRLKAYKPGNAVIVSVLRDGNKLDLLVQF